MLGGGRLSSRGFPVYRGTMADKDERKARLAEQLRANLRRRKAQARAMRDDAGAADMPDPAISADDAPSPDLK